MNRLSDTPRVDEVVSAWALTNTPNPQRVKALATLARRMERELRTSRDMASAYQRVNAVRGCPDGECYPVLPVNGVRVYANSDRQGDWG